MAQPADSEIVDGLPGVSLSEVSLAGDFDPATEDQWLALAEKGLKGRTVESLVSHTADGLRVEPLYTDGPDELFTGSPGAVPFTRSFVGTQREGGRWDLRVAIGGGAQLAVEGDGSGGRGAVAQLERGATSLLVGGGALGSAEALRSELDGVHLDLAPVVLAPGSGFLTSAKWLMTIWNDADMADASCAGGFGADPLGLLARTGHLPQGVERALADGAGLAAMASERYPNVRTWSVDATAYAEAGASEAQELAALLSTAVAYLRAMQDAGIGAPEAGRSIEIVLGADADFFTTIAKVRAARRVYAAMAESCGIDVGTTPPALVVKTLRRNLSRRDPWVNMLRVTSGAFAAALGGADSIVTASFDSELGEPSPLGLRMARNTQLLLSEESNVGRVIDPAGGSWYVESLSEAIAAEAWDIFRVLEGAGGMPSVLLDGTLAARIASVRDARMSAVATRKAPITGVSEFPNLDETLPEAGQADSGRPVEADPTDSATSCEPLRQVRWAEPFEALRDAADAVRDAAEPGGGTPRVFLANMGPVATHTARASWTKNFFEAGGLLAASSERGTTSGFASADEAAEDFAADPARIVCICSSDETYAELAADTARALTESGAERLYLAGKPGEGRGDLEAGGVDEFIHVGVNVLEILRGAHDLLGIPPAREADTGDATNAGPGDPAEAQS